MWSSAVQDMDTQVVRAIRKQVAGSEGDVNQLKPTRNSLLNISERLPNEILQNIFAWTIARERNYSPYSSWGSSHHFEKPEIGFYNFRAVCSRWFKVASNTPEVWRFWGNTLQDWDRLSRFNRAAPVDLVLDDQLADGPRVLSDPLRDELRDRVARNKIRQIHLRGSEPGLLASVLSSLTPDGEGAQEKRIESISFQTTTIPKELSDFFDKSRLPWLRYLEIAGILQIPLWDHLTTQMTGLTTLSLSLDSQSTVLTTDQLDKILAANPNLQHLLLCWVLPDGNDQPGNQASLRCLETIALAGRFHSIFQLLQRLELPATLDCRSLYVEDYPLDDYFTTLQSYMQLAFQHDIGFQNQLQVIASADSFIRILVKPRTNHPKGVSASEWPYMTLSISMAQELTPLELKGLSLWLITSCIPQVNVVFLQIEHILGVPEEFFTAMFHLATLELMNVTVSHGFLQPDPSGPNRGRKLLPSLTDLILGGVIVEEDDWQPLITYLVHQTSGGRQPISLQVKSISNMPPEVMEGIRGLVKHLNYSLEGSTGSNDYGDDRGFGGGMGVH